jgi:ribosome-binding protein aMBF1 (putative translation factor)
MKVLELQIPDDVASRVEQAASDRGLSVEELVRLSLEEKLTRDAEFENASRAVLAKNSELYERLA